MQEVVRCFHQFENDWHGDERGAVTGSLRVLDCWARLVCVPAVLTWLEAAFVVVVTKQHIAAVDDIALYVLLRQTFLHSLVVREQVSLAHRLASSLLSLPLDFRTAPGLLVWLSFSAASFSSFFSGGGAGAHVARGWQRGGGG